jgi:hypothetical protein
MSLAKNLGGRVGVKENFKGGSGVKIYWKILLQICDNPKRSQKFLKRVAFFHQKISRRKISGGGRVAFNENFIRGEGIL